MLGKPQEDGIRSVISEANRRRAIFQGARQQADDALLGAHLAEDLDGGQASHEVAIGDGVLDQRDDDRGLARAPPEPFRRLQADAGVAVLDGVDDDLGEAANRRPSLDADGADALDGLPAIFGVDVLEDEVQGGEGHVGVAIDLPEGEGRGRADGCLAILQLAREGGDVAACGKADEAVFDPVTATYYIRYANPAFNGGSRIQQFGIPNGKNQFIAGDFDGDHKIDEAVFDPVSATYYIRYSNPTFNGGSRIQQFGIPNGKNQFVVGDFSGSGRDD